MGDEGWRVQARAGSGMPHYQQQEKQENRLERPVGQVVAPVPWSLVGWGCPASLHWACTRASWMWRTYSGGWRVCASISSTSTGKLATAGHWHTRWVVIASLLTYAMWHMYHPTSTQMVYRTSMDTVGVQHDGTEGSPPRRDRGLVACPAPQSPHCGLSWWSVARVPFLRSIFCSCRVRTVMGSRGRGVAWPKGLTGMGST